MNVVNPQEFWKHKVTWSTTKSTSEVYCLDNQGNKVKQCYDTYKNSICVAPTLGVWGHKYVSQIKSFHNKAMKCFIGGHKFAPTDDIYGDLNWVSMYDRRKLKLLIYWNRLCKTDESRLLYKVFS